MGATNANSTAATPDRRTVPRGLLMPRDLSIRRILFRAASIVAFRQLKCGYNNESPTRSMPKPALRAIRRWRTGLQVGRCVQTVQIVATCFTSYFTGIDDAKPLATGRVVKVAKHVALAARSGTVSPLWLTEKTQCHKPRNNQAEQLLPLGLPGPKPDELACLDCRFAAFATSSTGEHGIWGKSGNVIVSRRFPVIQ